VSLAQMGIVEIHTWNSTIDDVDRPNRIVWDLDPGPEVTWKQVVSATKVVRDVLKALGLESWVKTGRARAPCCRPDQASPGLVGMPRLRPPRQ
jgi:DNA primase